MQVGFIGIGKMGAGLVTRLRAAGIETWAWNRSGHELANVQTVEEVIGKMTAGERIMWLMLPAGEVVDEMLHQVVPQLATGDIVIDGGNSFFKDTVRRAQELAEKGITYIDVGVSGGPDGAKTGACLMIGGETAVVEKLQPIWEAMAASGAYTHMGRTGAGHFAKMVHNGIEYGMMQAIAEGAAVLKESEFDFDLAKVFDNYNHRSVIESRLVEWTRQALVENPELSDTSSKIDHTGEGEWTVIAAKELGIAVPVIEESLEVRKRSDKEPENFRNKVVSAMRGKFGGHAVKKD